MGSYKGKEVKGGKTEGRVGTWVGSSAGRQGRHVGMVRWADRKVV